MADLTRLDNGEAMACMTAKLNDLEPDEVGPYFVLCMAILANNAPDVARFVMERADQRLEDAAAVVAERSGR